MKFKIQDFAKALDVLKLVPSRSGISCSEYLEVSTHSKGLALRCAADIMGVAIVPGEKEKNDNLVDKFKFYVERRIFAPFIHLNRNSTADLQVQLNGKSLAFKLGRRHADFTKVDPISGYSFVKVDGSEVPISKLSSILDEIRLASGYAAGDSLFPEMSCIHVDDKARLVMASNKFSVFASEYGKGLGTSFALPQALPLLMSEESKLSIGKSGARITFPNGYVFQHFNSKALADFPKAAITKALKASEGWPVYIDLPIARLCDVLNRLKVYVGAGSEDPIIEVSRASGSDRLTFQSKSIQGRFKETIKYADGKGAISAEWLLPSVLPFLEASRAYGDVKIAWDKATPYRFYVPKMKRTLLAPRQDTGK